MVKKVSGSEKMSNKTNKKMSNASNASKMSSSNFEKFSTSNGSVTCCNKEPSAFAAGISIILLFIILLININASMWIAKLEKINCACSDSFMRNYIKYFLFIMIPAIII